MDDEARSVLITGASAGIGLACAEALRAAGWAVTGASRRGAAPAGCAGLVMDVDDDESVRAGVAGMLAERGLIELRADGGPLRLASYRAVELRAPEVAVDAGSLRLFAEAAVEKLGALYQHVRGLYRALAGESETVVDGSALTRARSATILTGETMTINGKQIHLG